MRSNLKMLLVALTAVEMGMVKIPSKTVLNVAPIGPISLGDSIKFNCRVSLNSTVSSKLNFKIHGKCEGLRERTMYYSQLLTYQPKETKVFKPIININFLPDSGFTFIFYVVLDDGRVDNRVEFTLTPLKQLHIDLDKTNVTEYDSKYYRVGIENNKRKYLGREILDFQYTKSQMVANTYLTLPIEQIRQSFVSYEYLGYDRAYISFVDERDLFKKLQKYSGSKYAEIPLKIYYDGYFINYELLHNFFVNKETMEISPTKLEGYEPTNSFFLPLNGKKFIESYHFIFHLDGIGRAKSSFTKTLTYSYSKGLIGDCSNSKYCVIGGHLDG